MSKNAIAIAKNARRETAKASRKANAAHIASEAMSIQRNVETGAYDSAKGSSELVLAIKAGIKAQIAEHLLRGAAMRGAMIFRLGKTLGADDAARADIMREAERVLSLKAAHLGNSDDYRSAAEQRAYDTAKKIWQRAFAEAKGAPKAKRKPQPAKGAAKSETKSETKPETKSETKPETTKPLNFSEYVKRPPAFTKPADVTGFARNLAALMSNEIKVSAKAMSGDVRAMFQAFIAAAKALPDLDK